MPDPLLTKNAAPLGAAWAREVRARLSPLHLAPAREAEIVEELTQHLEDRWRELVAAGKAEDDATRLTLAELSEGKLARYMSPLRQAHARAPLAPGAPGSHPLRDGWQDLRYALRTVRAAPGFSAVAVMSLALGIGANTAIFSLWNGVLHASLPTVSQAEQLVMLTDPDERGAWSGRMTGARSWLTYEEFEQLRDHAVAFSALMASQSSLDTLQVRFDGATWEEVGARLVSGGFFEVLGVGAAMGRVFTAAEDRAAQPFAVISHSYWQRRFGGRPDALGSTFVVRQTAFTIIGIAPRGFVGETAGEQPDVWLPLRLQPRILPGRDRLHDTPPDKSMWLHVFGRLKPGVTLVQAEAEANAIFQAGLETFYGAAAAGERRRDLLDQHLDIHPAARGASAARRKFSQSLTALLVAVGVVLLIACANLANLLLARGTARQPELAVRLSLGASRGRLVRQLVAECLVLAVIGSAAALAVASVLHGALVRMLAASDSRFEMIFALDPLVAGFVVTAAFAALLVFGVFPAWHLTNVDPGASLREQHRGAVGRRGQARSGGLLVSFQLALSLPLLVGAGLLAQTVLNLQRVDLGYVAERLLLVRVDLREVNESARRVALIDELLEKVQQTPGVSAVSFSGLGLFSGGESWQEVAVEGYTPAAGEDRTSPFDRVGAGYFATLSVPIVLGRDIRESDRAGTPKVCVVNDAFAKRFFQHRNPIGMHVTPIEEGADVSPCQVVGVAGNARTQDLRGDVEPRFYVAAAQQPLPLASPIFLVRTSADAARVLAAVRQTIQRFDASLPIMSAAPFEEQMAPLLAQDRTTAQLAVVFGSVALALASIGLYGVLSFGMARRTSEIAIRIALGAQAGRVIAMILRETAALVGVGLALGGALAYVAARAIGSRLYGIAPEDPFILVSSAALLVAVAFTAAYLPARRASRLDPMRVLRLS
jgi:predicted permease